MSKKPYSGPSRKLVLAFDVGTTFSGVSYCVLDPGQVPDVRTVTRFPCQERSGGDSKIPTVVWYDRDDGFVCAGAEAVVDGKDLEAEEKEWSKAEWFKMHLRPIRQRPSGFTNDIASLPPNKSVVDVFADFLRYLFVCTKTYITETHASGETIWDSLIGNIDLVLTHPNGWEGSQQMQMRKAAVQAGIFSSTEEGSQRLLFATEGEASLHYCIQSGLSTEDMKKGEGTLIIDAGGGTVDLSAYKGTGDVFEEIAIPQCHFKGSIFVTARGRDHFKKLLAGTRFSDEIDSLIEAFDRGAKVGFRKEDETYAIRFTSARENEPDLGIRSGQIKVPGAIIATFFQPSVDCIVKAAKEQISSSKYKITSIFLVGGFAASDWLFKKLREAFDDTEITLSRPDSHVNKAVSDGAIYTYLDRSVHARILRWSYGTNTSQEFDESKPEHSDRRHLAHKHWRTGKFILSNRFVPIVHKGQTISTKSEYKLQTTKSFKPGEPRIVRVPIHQYRGRSRNPTWIDDEADKYVTAATIEVDASCMRPEADWSHRYKKMVTRYFFDVVLMFGQAELKAQLAWTEKGVKKRSDAKIIYEVELDKDER
ncbi:hypothetical protein FA15DRAFT_707737 [Coprinopsis marcescibilis]|uniref:Actin-like ATPase domain-containing protein n=1 Tax=Coprinopsis marcescibilis TaxID=230819 RepID=A0A5C3KLH4_COPMA|nr:hypothetical protein FA15DRAFT_707737 [Coprinopsis marcescibilis]